MKSSVFLFSSDIPDLLAGADPGTVAAAHPLWKKSMDRWGPWQPDGLLESAAMEKAESPLLRGWTGSRSGSAAVFLALDCSSVMDLAWKLVQGHVAEPWDAVIAVRQWSGRGQVRRPWRSLPGNLHVAWQTPALPAGWDGLTSLLPAWLTARSLRHLGIDVRLKWPNDLVLGDHKIGGILAEQRGEFVVVGLGLNLAQMPLASDLRENAALGAGSLGGRIDPATCWDRLVSESISWYMEVLPELQPKDFAHLFSDFLAWKGQMINIRGYSRQHDQIQGQMVGIAPDGSLMVACRDGVRHVSSGEMHLAQDNQDYSQASQAGASSVGPSIIIPHAVSRDHARKDPQTHEQEIIDGSKNI